MERFQGRGRRRPRAAAQPGLLLRNQVFCCIRLKSSRFNTLQCPILRDVRYPDGRIDQPHLITTVAVGAWLNKSVRLNAQTVDGVGNILRFDRPLGKVKEADQRADFRPFFEKVGANVFKPAFSVEDWHDGKKFYAIYGFIFSRGFVTPMSESASHDHLAGYRPDTAVYDAPEPQFVWLNDDTNNASDLASAALRTAQALMIEALQPRTILVKGFCTATSDLVVANFGTVGPADDVLLWPVGHKKIPLAKDQVVFGLAVPTTADGKPIIAAIPMLQLCQMKVTKDGA